MNFSSLAGLAPIKSDNAIRFYQSAPIELSDQNTSAPMEGYQSGKTAMTQSIMDGILSAVSSLTGGYMKKRDADQKKIDAAAEKTDQFEQLKALAELLRK